jgi:hypothetical protein
LLLQLPHAIAQAPNHRLLGHTHCKAHLLAIAFRHEADAELTHIFTPLHLAVEQIAGRIERALQHATAPGFTHGRARPYACQPLRFIKLQELRLTRQLAGTMGQALVARLATQVLSDDLQALGVARIAVCMVVPDVHHIQAQLHPYLGRPELAARVAQPSTVILQAQAVAIVSLRQLRKQTGQRQGKVLIGKTDPAKRVGADRNHEGSQIDTRRMLGPACAQGPHLKRLHREWHHRKPLLARELSSPNRAASSRKACAKPSVPRRLGRCSGRNKASA